jgi:hypothetical protein
LIHDESPELGEFDAVVLYLPDFGSVIKRFGAFADGSVRFLSNAADSILPALSTRAGGVVVPVPD